MYASTREIGGRRGALGELELDQARILGLSGATQQVESTPEAPQSGTLAPAIRPPVGSPRVGHPPQPKWNSKHRPRFPSITEISSGSRERAEAPANRLYRARTFCRCSSSCKCKCHAAKRATAATAAGAEWS